MSDIIKRIDAKFADNHAMRRRVMGYRTIDEEMELIREELAHRDELIESLQAENERLRESLAIAKFSFSQTYSGVDSVPLDRLSDYVRAMCQNAIDEINSTNSPID